VAALSVVVWPKCGPPGQVTTSARSSADRQDVVDSAGSRLRRLLVVKALRHTGQTLAASTGATTKDLVRRLGHASPAAANRYLHAVDGRDAEIASALSDLAEHGNAARLPKSIVVKH
jgi:integrase